MDPHKAEFIEFMVRCGVLTFGDFVTKSGRRTPFFINTGRYDSGAAMARLGRFYAGGLVARLGEGFDSLFGPAYKGIPLAVATAMALQLDHGRDVPFAFNRKEVKNHGEGGALVGRRPAPGDRVVIVEDVTTAGTSVRESVALLDAVAGVKPMALMVSVDRQERGQGKRGALARTARGVWHPDLRAGYAGRDRRPPAQPPGRWARGARRCLASRHRRLPCAIRRSR